MRVLIIGGTAFMGPYVARQLSAQDHTLMVFHRGQTEGDLPSGIQHVRSPLAAIPVTRFPDEVIQFKPDVVLHMIAMDEAAAHAVMHTFGGVARRVVAASSADVYRAFARLRGDEPGAPDPVPLAENAPLRERRFPYRTADTPPDDFMYSYDKILVEQIIMGDPQLPGTILRLPMVYGPHDKQHRLFSYLKRMDDGRPAILIDQGVAHWRNTRGYVENIAAAIALAVTDERAAGRIYNVAETEAVPEARWIERIGEAAGWYGTVVALPTDQLPAHLAAGFDPQHDLVLDSTRIRQELGYAEHVPQAEALRRTVPWERDHSPAQIDAAQFDYTAEDAALAARAS